MKKWIGFRWIKREEFNGGLVAGNETSRSIMG
jgi:hypothetical protein